MKYKRNRTESLTIRLTAEEKELIRLKARNRDMSITDFLLMSVIENRQVQELKPVLEKLTVLQKKTSELRGNSDTPGWREMKDLQSEIIAEVKKLISRA